MRLDVQLLHEFARLAKADVGTLVISEHDLEFEEESDSLHFVEMDSCSAD